MRVFICTDDSEQTNKWEAELVRLDHTPILVAGEFETVKHWLAAVRTAAARAECVLLGLDELPVPEMFSWLLGYAEALGTQVIMVTRENGGVLDANLRNVRYNTFEDACDFYFTSGRAMSGERAVPE